MTDPVTITDRFVFFFHGWPSQWVPSPYTLRGTHYTCCEQYMMAEKARVFGDEETLQKILAATSPRIQKALGRQVRNFDESVWNSVCRGVVYTGNLAKFRRDADLGERLLATGDRTIVEASPVDRIWGIGLAVEDPSVLDPARWQGKNWLGIALMQVRQTLRGGSIDAELQEQLDKRKAIESKGG